MIIRYQYKKINTFKILGFKFSRDMTNLTLKWKFQLTFPLRFNISFVLRAIYIFLILDNKTYASKGTWKVLTFISHTLKVSLNYNTKLKNSIPIIILLCSSRWLNAIFPFGWKQRFLNQFHIYCSLIKFLSINWQFLSENIFFNRFEKLKYDR